MTLLTVSLLAGPGWVAMTPGMPGGHPRINSGQGDGPNVLANPTWGVVHDAADSRWVPSATSYTLDPYNSSLVQGDFNPPSPWYPTGAIAIPSRDEFVVGDSPGAYINGLPYNGSIFILNATSGQEVRAIQVGNSATAFAYNPSTGLLYCGSSVGTPNSVFFVNLSSGDIVRTVHVVNVVGLAYDPGNDVLYVSNWTGVEALNGTTGATLAYVAIHWGVEPLVLDPLTNSLLVADGNNGTVYVVNISTFTVSSRLSGIGTVAFLYDPYSASIYSLDGDNNVSVIDARTLQLNTTTPEFYLGGGGNSMALDSARHVVYIGSCGAGVCEFYDTNDTSANRSLKLANYGWVAYDPVSNHLLAYDLDDSVHLFNGTDNQEVANVSMITTYLGGSLNPDNGFEYIATPAEGGICQLAGNVTVLDPSPRPTFVGLLPAGDGPSEVTYDSADHRVFVTNYCSNSVTVIDASNDSVVQRNLPVGGEPYGITYDPLSDTVFVADENSQNLAAINGSNLSVSYIPLPQGYPYDVAFDPVNNSLFVSDIFGKSVTMLNATSFVVTAASIPAGTNPQGLLYDPQNGEVYVANGGSDNISILNATSHTLVGEIPTVAGTTSLALDPQDHLLFATDTDGSRIVVVDTLNNTAETPTLPASQNPEGVIYDPQTHQVDVPNFGTGAINVLANIPEVSVFTAAPSPDEVGVPLSFAATVTNGTPPYIFAYSGLPPGCASANTSALTCSPAVGGSFNVTVTVTDSFGYTATASRTVRVLPALTPGPLSIQPSPTDVGVPVSILWNASGGVPPWALAYSGLPPGCGSEDVTTFSCTPTEAGVYLVEASVDDGLNVRQTAGTVLIVNAVPRIASFSAQPFPAYANGTLALFANVSGGSGPLAFAYTNLPPGCGSADTPFLTCAPTGAGTWNITLTVTDVLGKSATDTVGVDVLPAGAATSPSITAFFADPPNATLGTTVTLSVSVTGGLPPYEVTFLDLPVGCRPPSNNGTTVQCRPTASGEYRPGVEVVDQEGRETAAWTNLTILPVTETSAAPSSGEVLLAVVGGVVTGALVGVVVGFAVGRRRNRERPEAPDGP